MEDLKHVRRPALGECLHESRTIRIPVEGDTPDELDTIIHEVVHAACPWLDEWIVAETGTAVAKLLWRLGWRK